jgi:hypothetical protein
MKDMLADQTRMRRLQEDHRRRMQAVSCENLCVQCINIPTYWHFLAVDFEGATVLPHPTEVFAEYQANGTTTGITAQNFTSVEEYIGLVEENMELLNDAFSKTPFKFTYANRDKPSVYMNETWSFDSITYQQEIGSKLGVGALDTLNVYAVHQANSDGSFIGFATFPSYQYSSPKADGVYQKFSTVTEGGLLDNDNGYTLVHEVGHWLGLYHVFQSNTPDDPCGADETGDFVDDTATMNGSTQDLYCEHYLSDAAEFFDDDSIGDLPDPDTCPNLDGTDPVFNYMNYLNKEVCFEYEGEFTCGQHERMYFQWLLYRDSVERCEEGQQEFELQFQFDSFHGEENSFYLADSSGNIVFSSAAGDHAYIYNSPRLILDLVGSLVAFHSLSAHDAVSLTRLRLYRFT